MNTCGGASCGAFRGHPCQRPGTFWHCPKGSWTSKRLASLCAVREACAASLGGFRWAPTTSGGGASNATPLRRLIHARSAWSAEQHRVRDEMRMNDLSQQHEPTKQEPRAGDLGAARLCVWASSPPSYVSAPPAHPVEFRTRRGSCCLGPFRAEHKQSVSWTMLRTAHTVEPTGPLALLEHGS